MDNGTVLVVDDEKDICDLIELYLKSESINVLKAYDGLEALNILEKCDVKLIILDVMMPKSDGIKTCVKIRKEKNIPIIMPSAKNQDFDKILGLNSGADDYITKPFNPLELVARVKSQLRRYTVLNSSPSQVDQATEVNGLYINSSTHEVIVDGREVSLTPTEFSILEYLAKNRGRVISTETIYENVWHEPFYRSENIVAVHIKNIRDKIEINPKNPKYLKVVWGVGYKIEK